jgi:2-keto-3-deoxy-L-rhamnonate aldolase RhmA
VAETILAVREKIAASGKHSGVITTGNDNLLLRKSQGFQMLGLGLDGALMMRSLRNALAAVGIADSSLGAAPATPKYGD